jgi:hypothetical protein
MRDVRLLLPSRTQSGEGCRILHQPLCLETATDGGGSFERLEKSRRIPIRIAFLIKCFDASGRTHQLHDEAA